MFEDAIDNSYAHELAARLGLDPEEYIVCVSVNLGHIEWHSHIFGERNYIFPVQGESITHVDEFYAGEYGYNNQYGYMPDDSVRSSMTLSAKPGQAYTLNTAKPHAVESLLQGHRYCVHIQVPPDGVSMEEFTRIQDEEEADETFQHTAVPILVKFKEN